MDTALFVAASLLGVDVGKIYNFTNDLCKRGMIGWKLTQSQRLRLVGYECRLVVNT